MNWKAITFDWNQARAFLATAELGSLTAAANSLGSTQPTIGRQITALEDSLQVALFERVGRGLQLTPVGADLLDHVRLMGEGASGLSLAATGQSQDIAGTVTISAADSVSAWYLPDILDRLQQHAPLIEIELTTSNKTHDLRRRDADIAIRHVESTQGELIARKVRGMPVSLYASQAYLARHGTPHTVEELQDHSFIGYRDAGQQREIMEFLQAIGVPLPLDRARLRLDCDFSRWRMVQQGYGITMQSDFIAAQCPGMIKVLPDVTLVEAPIWIVSHRELKHSRRIRVVFDFLVEAFNALETPDQK